MGFLGFVEIIIDLFILRFICNLELLDFPDFFGRLCKFESAFLLNCVAIKLYAVVGVNLNRT
jgi:hypothetical protein